MFHKFLYNAAKNTHNRVLSTAFNLQTTITGENCLMKKIELFFLIVCCFYLAGCSKDAEVNAIVTDFESTTAEMAQKIDASPSAAGIDEAQNAFTARKAALKTKWDAIKDAAKFQVSADTQKRLDEGVQKSMKNLTDATTKNAVKLAMDKDAMPKLKALMEDLKNTISMPGSK